MIGGGDGMGPLGAIARAFDEAKLPISLVVITGRNEKLKAQLENETWSLPVHIYGFVREIPDMMRAADILVTKAGPGTISEAFNAGLPIILYSRLPGQEDGNVQYVIDQGAGVWAPTADQVVATLGEWLESPVKRQTAIEAAQKLARPQAARQIAQILAAQIGIE